MSGFPRENNRGGVNTPAGFHCSNFGPHGDTRGASRWPRRLKFEIYTLQSGERNDNLHGMKITGMQEP
jgi:hypothetical protein